MLAVGRRSGVPVLSGVQGPELRVNQIDGTPDAALVSGSVHPPADARRVRERNRNRLAELEPPAHRGVEAREPEQSPDRKPADRHDQPRPEQPELPLAPERAQLLLAHGRRPVASTRRRPTRVAARHRGAVERRVERVLVEPEPPAQRLPGATSPRTPLLALEDAGCLAEDVRLLAGVPLEPKPGLGARPARTIVTLERRERPVRRAAPRHTGERTTTNQFPPNTTSPPSSSASSDATK